MKAERMIPQPTMTPEEVAAWEAMARNGTLRRWVKQEEAAWLEALQRRAARGANAMSFVPVVRPMYQLVCDGCGFDRYPVEEDAREPDIADAIDFDGWNEVEDGIYCGDCSWRCRCDKAFRGNPPPPGMCEECERNQYGRLIDVTKDWEPCPGSGRELFLHEGLSTAPCPGCPAHVPVVMTAGKGVADAHLRRRRSNPIAFEPGTRIRDVWTGAVAEVVKHDPRTGTTQLRNTGTGTVQTMNSHNNAFYVAVLEAE